MAVQADNILDLVAGTLPDLGRLKWTDLSTDTQEHVFFRNLMKKERVSFDSGKNIQWNVLVDHNHQAAHVGLYNVDNPAKRDGMKQASVPWRHSKTDWSVDEHEITMNSGASRVFDLLKEQRAMGMVSLAEIIEAAGWGKPADSNDDTTPYGVKMAITANSASTTGGFNGGAPTGFSAGYANLLHSRWKNWNFQYTTVNKADCVAKMREASIKTKFTSPVEMPTYDRSEGRRGVYCNYSRLQAFEALGEAQNENLGRDIASMDGVTTFRRIPIQYVPVLDNDSAGLIYGIDWGSFYIVFMSGWYMKETGPIRSPTQHNVIVTYIDLSWNTRCTNRRGQWVGTL